MKFINLCLMVVLTFVGSVALAQVAPAAPTYLDGIIAWIKANGLLLTSAVSVVEVLLRLIPSSKALSILVPVRYACDGLAFLLTQLSSLLGVLVASLNNTTAAPPK